MRTSNDSWVAGIILRNVLLHLAYEISANIGSLGVDSTTNTSKQSNRRATQAISCNSLKETSPVVVWTVHVTESKQCDVKDNQTHGSEQEAHD